MSNDQTLKQKEFFKPYFLVGLCLVLGIGVGWWGRPVVKRMMPRGERKASGPLRVQQGYVFINPLISCARSENKEFREYKPLESKLEALIAERQKKNDLVKASVYFRSLDRGRWTGINEGELYNPASLLKVPLMMAFYRLAETDPSILDKKIEYRLSGPDENEALNIKSVESLKSGQIYTISELIEAMIIYSDNNARTLLRNNINVNSLLEIYSDLGILLPSEAKPIDDFMSVKSFAFFLRVLYNGSYLGNEMSERALKLMSQSKFKEGIVAGVPEDIIVAHKFGERSINLQNGIQGWKELHDCGIVYYPERPYLLCVMTKGRNFDQLKGVIRDISDVVFQQVDLNQ